MTQAEIWRQTLGDVLRRTAARMPHKTAIICGATTWSYAQLDQTCNALAAGLSRHGIMRGDRVAVLSRNSHAFVALRFALTRIGAILVPINFMLKDEEAAYILGHTEAKLLCVDSELAPLGRRAAQLSGTVQLFLWLPSEHATEPAPDMLRFDTLLGDPGAVPDAGIDGASLAQIIYTSGTESRPKGAMLTHQAVISEYVSVIVDGEIRVDDRILHAMPLFHCAQLDNFLGPSLYVGGTNVITSKPAPDNILPLLGQHRITSYFSPPTVWISLLRSALFDKTDLSALKKGYYGASIMPMAILQEMQRRLPHLRLWNFYGQTEIAPLAVALQPEDQIRKAGSTGRPVLNVETRIIDDAGADVRPGEIGEIVHRSPQLLTGYYRDEERTKIAFEGGWFHSGDLGVLDEEGYLTIVDRKKDMIKTGGENVASREVEEVIYRLPAVSEVAVIGLPDPRWIEAVTAVIVLKKDAALTEAAVLAHCTQAMAHFKAPKRAYFVEALPKNPSGKILKHELRKRFE